MVFGTFDIVHPGHINFFEQARTLAGKRDPYLIVSLARDKNVLRIKGKAPQSGERIRLTKIKSIKEVDRAILGALGNHLPHIIKEQPDIIALGYDQNAYVKGLRIALKNAGLTVKIVRLKPYFPNKYKTSLIRKSL